MLYFAASQPLTVKYLDSASKPIPNATINWTVTPAFGHLNTPTQFVSKTNTDGIAFLVLADPNPLQLVEQSQVKATPPVGNSVSFWITSASGIVTEDTPQDDGTIGSLNPGLAANRTINATAGALLPAAFKVAIGATNGQAIPHVAIAATNVRPVPVDPGSTIVVVDDPKRPSAQCAGNFLSDSKGIATCNLQIGSGVGNTSLYFVAANGNIRPAVTLNVALGAPGKVTLISGDGQTGQISSELPIPLAIRVVDLGGNALPKIQVSWNVIQGSATLSANSSTTDANGAASVKVRFGSSPGQVKVKALVNNSLSIVFNESAGTAPVATIAVVSGDNQTALVGLSFPQPLTVAVGDSSGNPVPSTTVNFTVTGDATVSPSSVATSSDGTATVSLTAGTTAGSVTVTAESSGIQIVFQSLTVIPPGPQVSISSFVSAAGRQSGLTPCGLGAILGSGLAPGIVGTLTAQPGDDGAYPATLGPVQSLLVGGLKAPITAVSNSNGVERIEFQTPCEVPPGIATAALKVQDISASVDGIPVASALPSIFTTVASDGLEYALAFRADGTLIGPASAPTQGETIRVWVTGVGQTTPSITTGQAGVAGQAVITALTGGINNAGATIKRAEYLAGQLGVYFVDIEIPLDTAVGPYQPLVIATPDLLYSNTVHIPISVP